MDIDSIIKSAGGILKVNLCSGPISIPSYLNIDIDPAADLVIDLEKTLIPLENNAVDLLACVSAINYFSLDRALEIIHDVFRIMKPGATVRFSTQDLRKLTQYYVNKDTDFFDQLLPNGQIRFPGISMADKLNKWFYGFPSNGKSCKYVYDFETLAILFKHAGFENIKNMPFKEGVSNELCELDNREDQMFFLECQKPGNTKKYSIGQHAQAVELWKSGKEEQAWQIFLENINSANPDDRASADVIDIALQMESYDDLIAFANKKLKKNIQKDIWSEAIRIAENEKSKIKVQTVEEKQKIWSLYGIPVRSELSDDEHLMSAIQWLVEATKATNLKGVSADYDYLTQKWHLGYPETTGYIIPTFLKVANLTYNEHLIELATKMGDWEISLQWQNGGYGESVGLFAEYPRVFNTSQIMYGMMALYSQTKEKKFLDSAIRAADWLVSIQDEDGKWTQNTYDGPRSYHDRVAWALEEMYKITGNINYRQSAEKNIKWTLSLALPNGYFTQTSLTDPNHPWTHLIGYTLVGLLEFHRLNPDFNKEQIKNILITASKHIEEVWNTRPNDRQYLGFQATYTSDWKSDDVWSCVTGNAQLEYFLRKMKLIFPKHSYESTANEILKELKWTQFVGKDYPKELFGGISASSPINGLYGPFKIYNWSVKFYADALLNKISPTLDSEYLG